MTYKELKDFNIESINNIDDLDNFRNKLLTSKTDDIIRYINYLKWWSYDNATMVQMKIITKLLSHETLMSIEKEYEHINFGLIQDLDDIPQKKEDIINIKTIKKIIISNDNSEDKLKVKAVLRDDFEFILICEKDKELKVYGAIEDFGVKYIYELEDENQDYLKEVIDAEVGIKANIKAHYKNDKFIKKTFIKIDDDISDYFTMVIKTVDGINSKSFGGVTHTIKSEKILDYFEKDILENIEEIVLIK